MNLIPRTSIVVYLKHMKHERQIENMDISFIQIEIVNL